MESLPETSRGFLYYLGPTLGVSGIVILCGLAINAYVPPIESFCAELPSSATPEAVLALARSKDFRAYNAIESRGFILVAGQRSPFFRYTCEVAFKDDRQIGRRVIASD